MSESAAGRQSMGPVVDIAVKLGLVFVILAWCFQILRPFIHLVVWGGVIAIALYPAFVRLSNLLGERPKTAVTVIVLLGFAIVIVPVWSFTGSIVSSAQDLRGSISAGTLSVPVPNDSVRDWPLIGERVYAGWSEASRDLSLYAEEHSEQIRNVVLATLNRAAGAGIEALQFLISILIAAVLLLNAKAASVAMQEIFSRMAGEHGESLRVLSIATIRSIAVGVLGIAAIQATLGGLGIVAVGVPAAGLWALLILMVAIVQLPPLLILLPIAVYVFSAESTTVAVLFAIWSVIVSFADVVLKPLLLGRGVDAPMIVILLGAIGGMLLSGIVGLFTGAVILGLSYKLLKVWLYSDQQ